MIKIVQVTGSAEWAGGERQLLDLVAYLDPVRFRFQVVCPEPGPHVKRLAERRVPARVVELSPLINPAAVVRLMRGLRSASPDIVQSHGVRSNFYARLACHKAGLRHISTVHNALADYPVPHWKKAVYLALDRWSARWTDRVVCVSESLRRDLIEQGLAPEKLTVIPNGVDPEAFNPAKADPGRLRAEWGCPPGDSLLVGMVGRLTEQKGHRYFLEAFREIVRDFPATRGVIIGDGPLRSELEARARALGLDDKLLFAGVRHDMPDVFAALGLVVLPSVSGGLPYVLLEALVMGRPVVASAVDGVTEIVPEDGRGARLVPPCDVQALVHAIRSVLADPIRALEMALIGRERALRRFSMKAMVESWEHLYKELAGQ